LDPLISLERLIIQNSNVACGLIVWDAKPKNENRSKGGGPRSRAISSSLDLLNIWATEALRNGKIRESIAFDFQHGYQMWTSFVNFLDHKKQKLI